MATTKYNSTYFFVLMAVLFAAGLFIYGCTSSTNYQVKIYVANEGDGTISVISTESLEVIKTIKLDGMPHNVNVDPLGRYVYATNHEGEEDEEEMDHDEQKHVPYLRIIDAKSYKIINSIAMQQMAAHAVPSRDGKFVYVSREGGNSIVEVDVEQEKVTRKFIVGNGPHGFVISNDNSQLYVPNMKSHDMSIVDLKTENVETMPIIFEEHTCDTPVAMGITQDDNFAFVTCGKSFEVYKFDTLNKKFVGRVQLNEGEFPGPIQTPVYPGSQYLYVPNMRQGAIHKISIGDFQIIKDIPTGNGAHGIAYSADGKFAFVTNTYDDSLSVVDLSSETAIKTIPVGSKPNGVAVSNGKNQGW